MHPMAKIVTISRKLLWSHIKEMYQNEWVELIDSDWEWGSASPRRALVRNHAPDRNELLKKIHVSGPTAGSVVLFVGHAGAVVSFELAGIAA